MGYPYYKELIFMSLQYLFVIRKLERHKTITPNSGRPIKIYILFGHLHVVVVLLDIFHALLL